MGATKVAHDSPVTAIRNHKSLDVYYGLIERSGKQFRRSVSQPQAVLAKPLEIQRQRFQLFAAQLNEVFASLRFLVRTLKSVQSA